jgi:Mn2+/Fe2+ NRAMP family transporter
MPTDTSFDPYGLSPETVQEPPRSLAGALRRIGPGLILAGGIVGTGELIATTHVGAQAGFALLWLVMLSCFIKVFVQIELGRYAISSGETTLRSLHALPKVGVPLVWWWLIMVAVTQTQVGAMVGGVGQAMHLAATNVSGTDAEQNVEPTNQEAAQRRPELPWALLVAAVTAVLVGTGSYRIVQYVTTTLVIVFTFMTVACVIMLSATDRAFGWPEVASGLTFQLPPEALMAAFAMIGITGVGATELISYPYWCIEKGYARYTGPRSDSPDWQRRAKGWLRVMHVDAWAAMVLYTISTLAFYLLGAAVLFGDTEGRGLPRTISGMLETLAGMYEPVMGKQGALCFIVIGAFATLYSTLFAGAAGTARMLTDFLWVNGFIRLSSQQDRLRWVRGFGMCLPFTSLLLFILIADPTLMVTIGGLIQAVTLPIIGVAALFLRYRRTDRRLVPGMVWDLFLWVSVLVLLGAALYGVFTQMGKLLPVAAAG